MIHKLLLAALLIFGSMNIASAKARIPVCFPCETLETVQELPAESRIQEMTAEHVNISYLKNEYGIVWVSVWNTDGRYVLSDDSNTTYYDIDDEAAQILMEDHDFDIATEGSPLSFWKKIGGKILFLGVLAVVLYGYMGSSNDAETEEG